jgi:hypothetical protein
MKTKLQLALVAITLLISFNVKADTIRNAELNLNNPDVRKCLLEATVAEGWKLQATYIDANEKIVMVFGKDKNTKVYTSKEILSL